MTIDFVERKLLTCANTFYKVGALWLGIGHFRNLVHNIRYGAFKALENFAFGSLYVRSFSLRFEAFSLENYLTSVGICISYLVPNANSVGMLLGSVNFYLYRRLVVLVQEILHGIKVMLSHISESAAIVIPIATECLVSAVNVIGFVRSRTKPHVIIKV